MDEKTIIKELKKAKISRIKPTSDYDGHSMSFAAQWNEMPIEIDYIPPHDDIPAGLDFRTTIHESDDCLPSPLADEILDFLNEAGYRLGKIVVNNDSGLIYGTISFNFTDAIDFAKLISFYLDCLDGIIEDFFIRFSEDLAALEEGTYHDMFCHETGDPDENLDDSEDEEVSLSELAGSERELAEKYEIIESNDDFLPDLMIDKGFLKLNQDFPEDIFEALRNIAETNFVAMAHSKAFFFFDNDLEFRNDLQLNAILLFCGPVLPVIIRDDCDWHVTEDFLFRLSAYCAEAGIGNHSIVRIPYESFIPRPIDESDAIFIDLFSRFNPPQDLPTFSALDKLLEEFAKENDETEH